MSDVVGPLRCERVLHDCVDLASIDRIQDLLGRLWSDAVDIAQLDQMLFETAVVEVAGNIVRHTHRTADYACSGTFRVYDGALEAVFRDTGDPVDLDLDAAELPDSLAESGRGLAIARAAVDELSYRRIDTENQWRIFRVRTR